MTTTMNETPPQSLELVATREFELDQRRAKAYSESGYWPDAASIAKALVKIEAGRSLGLPAIVAMSEVHVIDGKPTLGAGALASLVKSSGRYDYRVLQLDDKHCQLRFYEQGQVIGESTFSVDDAQRAGLLNRGPWKQYPRNMCFARAMSNGVAWFCPDVTSGRVYTPEEITATEEHTIVDVLADELEPDETIDHADDPEPFAAADDDDVEWEGEAPHASA